jgi:hypothetical protein
VIRVKSLIQFVSQVSPPSVENACSQRGDAVCVAADDRHAFPRVVGLEDADAVLERADDRRLKRPAGPAVRPVDRPGLRLGMKEAD